MESTAVADQVLALLRDRGPMTTAELANEIPGPSWSTCGHDDCTRSEHQRGWPTMNPSDLRERVLYGMHRRGVLNRTPLDTSRPVLWWPNVERTL
jgi:hypothetical protein